RGNDGAEEIARAVALRAMAKSVDEIGAAIPRRRMPGICSKWLAVQKQPFPDSDRTANVERKWQLMGAHSPLHRRERHEVGEEIADVLYLRALIGGVGKRRIVMRA